MTKLAGLSTHFALGYSGCDRDVGEAALSSGGSDGLVASNNGYDWLGTGIYFWEGDPDRAWQWADEAVVRHRKRYEQKSTPIRVRRAFVVGAVIKLSHVLDLTTISGTKLVRDGYWSLDKELAEANISLPKNTEDADMKGRFLDCAVINHTCQEYCKLNKSPLETVRGVFPEGQTAYPGAGFLERTHTQLCVRVPDKAIVAYFRVPRPA